MDNGVPHPGLREATSALSSGDTRFTFGSKLGANRIFMLADVSIQQLAQGLELIEQTFQFAAMRGNPGG